MYGNNAANDVHKKGMFTHLYGTCKATGCGPNYCCCTDNLSGNNYKKALDVVGISPSGGLAWNGLIAQSIVQAACVGAYNKGSGQVAAFRKPCRSGSPTCAQLCKTVGHGSCFQVMAYVYMNASQYTHVYSYSSRDKKRRYKISCLASL